MTQDNSSQVSAASPKAGGDLFNTAAGWVLFAAGLGLGLSILSGKFFHGDKPQRPEKLGYVIEGAVEEGGSAVAEKSIAEVLNATPQPELVAAGEKIFAKCQSCHTINAGGANGIGPNLQGTMGKAVASHPGFAYSAELKAHGGSWDWENMNTWLKNPKAYVPGTKMSFAGLAKVEDRAAVIAYLNSQGSNLPLPAAPAAAAPAGDASAAPAEGETPAATETPAQ
ncbi:MAG: c-type cytochrome [Erythrobacter sp.]